MPPSSRFSNLFWYDVVNVAVEAALAGDRDTAYAALEARNHRLNPIRGALHAAVDAILDGASTAAEATAPHRDSPFKGMAPSPLSLLLGRRAADPDDFEN